MVKFIYIFSVYVCVFSNTSAYNRKIGLLDDIHCANSSDTHGDKLVVVKAVGDRDVLYYFWDYGSKPTFLVVQVPANTTAMLHCNSFLDYKLGSVNFSSEPTFVFGVVLNKVYDFNDTENNGIFNRSDTTVRTYNSEDLHWNISTTESRDRTPRILVTGIGKLPNSTTDGFLQLAACAYTKDGNAVYPPHLLHSANSTEIDVIFDNFPTYFANSRLATEFLIFSSFGNSTFDSQVQKTMDDENTPGVFTLNTLIFNETADPGYPDEGYLQWRPVVYTTSEKVVKSSTKTHEYNMTDVKDRHFLNYTLLNALYGDGISTRFMKSQIVSFGSTAGEFFKSSSYSSWSFVLGIGSIPQLPFSIVVLIIIVIGLGLPVLIIFGGILFIIYERMKRLRLMSCLCPGSQVVAE